MQEGSASMHETEARETLHAAFPCPSADVAAVAAGIGKVAGKWMEEKVRLTLPAESV